MKTVQIEIVGMTCASCVSHVEKALGRLNGVDTVGVNLANGRARIRFNQEQLNVAELVRAVEASGYKAELDRKRGEQQQQQLPWGLILAGLLSFPLFLAMLVNLLGIEQLMFLHAPLFQFIPASIVQFVLGARFYRSAFHSLRVGAPGMDLLIVLGTSAAWGFSVFNGFFAEGLGVATEGLYFESSSIIITLVLLGRFLEESAKGKASRAIMELMNLQPETAWVQGEGGAREVPVESIVPGDHVLLRPGDRAPVDGVVVSGSSAVDESMVSGESLPVEKEAGARIVSGSLNGHGSLIFVAEKVGKDSVLARIIAVVEEAQGSKAPIQKTADKVSAIFVPMVLLIAALTFALWVLPGGSTSQALVSVLAVLVIACPCALGLATPTAIMVGTGVGASRGVLIKNGEVLQTAGSINVVVLDKTGTITRGIPELGDIIPVANLADREGTAGEALPLLTEDEALCLAASLEQYSEHPFAHALLRAAEDRKLSLKSVENFQAVPGKGISAQLNGGEYYIGTAKFMEGVGIDVSAFGEICRKKDSLEERGASAIVLAGPAGKAGAGGQAEAEAGVPLALFAIADEIRGHSRAGVELLRKQGMEVYMLTGDNRGTATAIAEKAGISHVIPEVLPEDKADKIRELKQKGFKVAMVGDGINDAPALALADMGIAMGSGSDIAMESADITLLGSDLREVAAAIKLSDKTMQKIRQNLFWAFFYNSIGIPLAALGLLNPIIAAAAMAFSSVSVILNSLSLRRFSI